MRTRITLKKNLMAVLVVAVSATIALPLLLFPVGLGRQAPANILVGRAYAATYPDQNEEEVLFEDYAITGSVGGEGLDYDEDGLIVVGEGTTIAATYFDDIPVDLSSQYDGLMTATIVQHADEDDIPIEILDTQTFISVDRMNYIQTEKTIIKEEPFMSSVTVATIGKGQSLTRVSDGDSWSKVRTQDGVVGYLPTYCLSESPVAVAIDRTVWVQSDSLRLRKSASTDSAELMILKKHTKLRCTSIIDQWYEVTTPDGTKGFVAVAYTTTKAPPTPTPKPTPKPKSGSSGGSKSGGSPAISGLNVDSLISVAKSMLGVDYVWAGESKNGVDCSGLVVYCYRQLGVELPHQANRLKNVGESVSRSNIAVGDIVCWALKNNPDYADHTGIYVGNGQVIHASSSKDEVRYGNLDMGTIVAIRRIIA